jgi:hypothetical protein
MRTQASAVHRFEMAVTRAEFVRLLPHAVGPVDPTWRGDRLEGATEGIRWSLRCAEMPHRRVGAFDLPVLDVTLTVGAPDANAERRFVERFLAAYQRAGG